MAPNAESYKCPDCSKNVTKSQKSVGCSYCNKYFHIHCAGITVDQFMLMAKNKIFKFICSNCLELPKCCNVQEELNKGFTKLMSFLQNEIDNKMQETRRAMHENLECALQIMQENLNKKINELEKQQPVNNTEVQTDNSNANLNANTRPKALEHKLSVMERRLNRANIIIRGLPRNIKDLRTTIIKICSLCDVHASYADLQHCTYFSGGKAVLVKFNSVLLRDTLMINYNKKRKLALADVLGELSEGVQSQITLNDHFTHAAKELISVCRKLRNDGKILKYTFRNYDVPKATIVKPDGSVDVLCHEQCVNLLDGDDRNNSTVNFSYQDISVA